MPAIALAALVATCNALTAWLAASCALGGLIACLFLAFWVPMRIWLAGLALIGAGLIWHLLARRRQRAHPTAGR